MKARVLIKNRSNRNHGTDGGGRDVERFGFPALNLQTTTAGIETRIRHKSYCSEPPDNQKWL